MKPENRIDWLRDRRDLPFPLSARWDESDLLAGSPPYVFHDEPTVEHALEAVPLAETATPRYRSLLVPLDGEPFSEHALPWALAIARRTGAEIRLVHVESPRRSLYWTEELRYDHDLDAILKWRPEAYLSDLTRRLARVTTLPITMVSLRGQDIADTLCTAAQNGTDLVVMAAHGRGRLGRIWFGSVAEVLRQRLAMPLLLVRGYNAPADLTAAPQTRHILIPLDGTPSAEEILEPAFALGTATDADHTLLRVVSPVLDYALTHPVRRSQRPHVERQKAEAWRYLCNVADRFRHRELRLQPRLVVDEETTARAILHYVQKHDVDVIALAVRRRRGLARLFQSRVADRILRAATVPVLVCGTEPEQGRAAALIHE